MRVDEDRDDELAQLLAEVRRIDVQASRLVTSQIAGEYTSVFRGSGLEFDGVREYEEGDDPRIVDWNVTARTGRPYVKKFIDERELTVFFALDLSASMGGGFGVWSARQTAARICACLAFAAIRNNDKVGLIAFSDEVEKYVAANKGTGHVLRIVRDCLALRGKSDQTENPPAIEAERSSRNSTVSSRSSTYFFTNGRPTRAVTFQSTERGSSPSSYSRTPSNSSPDPRNTEL